MRAQPSEEKPPQTRGRTLDHAASVYDLLAPVMTLWQENRYRRLAIRLLTLKGDEQILDVGCGTGILTRQLAQALSVRGDACAVGVDAAPKMIRVARRNSTKTSNVRFDIGVAEALPYEDQCFDCAVSTFFFHHIDAELKRCALTELRRVLKPGGRLVIVDVDVPYTWFGQLCAWSGYWLFRQEEIRENIRGELRLALADIPFQEVKRVAQYSGYIGVYCVIN